MRIYIFLTIIGNPLIGTINGDFGFNTKGTGVPSERSTL